MNLRSPASLLHAALAAEDSRLAGLHDEGLDVLDALRADREALRWAAAPHEGGAAGPPALRLLLVPAWGRALGEGAYVFLQGRGRELFVRVAGARRPDLLRVRVGDWRSTCERVVRGARVFELPEINARTAEEDLWFVPDADPVELLRPGGVELGLEAAIGGWPPCVLAPETLAPLGRDRVRLGFDAARETDARGHLHRAVVAYHRRAAPDFVEAIAGLLEHHVGDTEAAADDRDWWRRLTRWQALWVRAMLAELSAMGRPTALRYGCDRARRHPQLGRVYPSPG